MRNENNGLNHYISDEELQEATNLAYDLDEFFRVHNKEYAERFPDSQKQKESLADKLLEGNTIEIKRFLYDMEQYSESKLNRNLADFEQEFEKTGRNLIPIRSASNSNYKDMIAFVDNDDKVYLGKKENYLFHTEHIPYYDNSDHSFTFISDNKEIYRFLYGEGFVLSQQEMLEKGYCLESDYAEFAHLQKGVLSQFEKIREFTFAGEPFRYLENAEKTEEQNYNQIDGQINNEQAEEKNTMTVLVVEPMKEPYIKEIGIGLEALQNEVGGYIQAIYPFEEQAAIICNEEGKLNGLELNRALRDDNGVIYDIIAGTFLITGLTEDNFGSLPDELTDKFSKQFQCPEMFMRAGGQIVAIPVKLEQVQKPSLKQQLQQAKKEQGERAAPKPPKHSPPEL